jgi:hypothetical protein
MDGNHSNRRKIYWSIGAAAALLFSIGGYFLFRGKPTKPDIEKPIAAEVVKESPIEVSDLESAVEPVVETTKADNLEEVVKPDFKLPEGAVLYLTFDKETIIEKENRVEDSSGNRNDGVICAQIIGDENGQALCFDGSTDHVYVEDSPSLDIQNTITILAWIKPEKNDNWDGIVTKGEDVLSYDLQLAGEHGFRFTYNFPAEGWRTCFSPHHHISLDDWHHVGITYDGSELILYHNGAAIHKEYLKTSFNTNDERLFIGADFPGGDEYFRGLLDEIAIFNRALSKEEVQEMYKKDFNADEIKRIHNKIMHDRELDLYGEKAVF